MIDKNNSAFDAAYLDLEEVENRWHFLVGYNSYKCSDTTTMHIPSDTIISKAYNNYI
ncbi:hypothetical protein DSUL_50386 [Desulfovibrionales bacterium]